MSTWVQKNVSNNNSNNNKACSFKSEARKQVTDSNTSWLQKCRTRDFISKGDDKDGGRYNYNYNYNYDEPNYNYQAMFALNIKH